MREKVRTLNAEIQCDLLADCQVQLPFKTSKGLLWYTQANEEVCHTNNAWKSENPPFSLGAKKLPTSLVQRHFSGSKSFLGGSVLYYSIPGIWIYQEYRSPQYSFWSWSDSLGAAVHWQFTALAAVCCNIYQQWSCSKYYLLHQS